MMLSEGQMSDFKGAALMLPAMPKARELLADKGYDADWFRAALAKRGVAACIPSKSNRKVAIPHDALLYKQRHKIENMFGRLKDWRRIHTRYDRCAHTYFSAICLAAAVLFWLSSMSPEPSLNWNPTFACINPFVSAVGRDLDDGYGRAHHVGDLRRYAPNHLTNPVNRPGRILRRIGIDYSPNLFSFPQRKDCPRSTSVARTNNLILFNAICLTVKPVM